MLILPTQSACSAQKKEGEETLQFLIEHFSFLGFDGQYWMLIVVGLIAVLSLLCRRTAIGPETKAALAIRGVLAIPFHPEQNPLAVPT
jgi:hypothetical protein